MDTAVDIQFNRNDHRVKGTFLPGLRFYLIVCVLCLIAYGTSNFHFNSSWGSAQILGIITLIILTLLIGGISLPLAAFCSVALLPNTNSFIPLIGFSITGTEIFMLLFCTIFLVKEAKLERHKFAFLTLALFITCILSLVGSPLGMLSIGMLLRFGILLFFITIVVCRKPEKSLWKPIFYGFLIIPLIASSTYAGEGLLLIMFSANLFGFSRVAYSFQYPIWYSLIIPFLVFVKSPKILLLPLGILIAYLIVLSFARSIIIGTLAAGILFILYFRNRNPVSLFFTKALIIAFSTVTVIIVTIALGFFEFTSTESGSNVTRFYKMELAISNIKKHPLLGSGFGASNDATFAEKRSGAEVFSDIISPEFGPLTVLAEIGILGGLFLTALIFLSMKYGTRCLKDRDMSTYYKWIVLITFGGFVSSFLNSNSTSSIILYIFLIIPIVLYKKHKFDLLFGNV